MAGSVMDLRNVALVVWIAAWIAAVGSYLVSAAGGHLDWCVPHLTGCESISASGRYGWGFFLFKAMMLPTAALLIV